LNGLLQTNPISGEVDWQIQVVSVPAGLQTLRWRYVKDQNTSQGLDAGFLSEVQFESGTWLQLLGTPINGQAQLIVHGVAGRTYEIQVSTNLLQWFSLGTVTPTNNSTLFIDPNAGNSSRFYRMHDVTVGAAWFDTPVMEQDGVHLFLHSQPGGQIQMQASTSLTNWNPLATLTNATGAMEYIDTQVTNFSARYYRARILF